MPYINFSEDDLYRANTADLVSFLQSHGEQVKKVGTTYQYIYMDGSGTHDSVTISGGKWYDHKNRRGGYAVKFLQEFLGFSFQDSVIELLGGHCNAQTVRSAPREAPKPVQKAFELPEPNSDMRRVFAYLTKQRRRRDRSGRTAGRYTCRKRLHGNIPHCSVGKRLERMPSSASRRGISARCSA